MLSYGLRLNVDTTPFVVPPLALTATVLHVTGHPDQGVWLAVATTWRGVFFGVSKFWLRANEENEAREWQKRHLTNDADAWQLCREFARLTG